MSELGVLVFGICGGYQMLGTTLEDPYGVEYGGKINGIGLLPAETVFQQEKTRSQASGRFNRIDGLLQELSDKPFTGYEIHMGTTKINHGQALLTVENIAGKPICASDGINNGNIFGSYIHGLFDEDGIAQTIVNGLLRKKGLETSGIKFMSYRDYKEKQYDLLAAEIRKSVDMAAVYKILSEGI
jgi:adenosylcobyric acid synthase